MRAGPASRLGAVSIGAVEYFLLGWRQAGFGSFAYRLAQLRISRPAVIGSLALAFLLV
jgi:hypothetical protein